MKRIQSLLLTCMVLLAFSACNKQERCVDYPESSVLSFNASIKKSTPVSRAHDASWDANDAIGIYMKTAGSDLTTSVIAGCENVKYTTTTAMSDALFTSVATDMAYPDDGSNVDFVAYYPHKDNVAAYVLNVDVTDQSTPAAIDLLYSNDATGKNKDSQSPVMLTFTHELAKIVINTTAGKGISNLTGLTLKVTGITPTATYALKDGILTPTGNAADISMRMTGSVAEAIVVPGTAGDRTFIFELNGNRYKYEVPATTTFEKGHKYTYEATLAADGVTFVNPEGTITDWIDTPGGTITPVPDGSGGGGTGPTPTPVEFFREVFGDGTSYGSGSRPKISAMDNWSMKAPITYTDSYGRADIRSTTTVSPSVWFPSVSSGSPVVSELVIGGIDQLGAYTDVKLSYDVAANNFSSANIDHLEVYYALTTAPATYVRLTGMSGTFTANNAFITVADIAIPDGLSSLRFFYDANNGGEGYRLDNLILTGVAP